MKSPLMPRRSEHRRIIHIHSGERLSGRASAKNARKFANSLGRYRSLSVSRFHTLRPVPGVRADTLGSLTLMAFSAGCVEALGLTIFREALLHRVYRRCAARSAARPFLSRARARARIASRRVGPYNSSDRESLENAEARTLSIS